MEKKDFLRNIESEDLINFSFLILYNINDIREIIRLCKLVCYFNEEIFIKIDEIKKERERDIYL
jgi:hypothetical protein